MSTTQGTQTPSWDAEGIKAEVRRRGTTLAALAAGEGLVPQAGSQVLFRPWPALEAVVATFLGVLPGELWPERYREDRRTPLRGGGVRVARRVSGRASSVAKSAKSTKATKGTKAAKAKAAKAQVAA